MENITSNNYFIVVLAMILESLIPIAMTAFGLWLINYMKKKGANEEQIKLLEQAFTFLTRAVTNTNQLWVDAVKNSEGRLTEEQQAAARAETERIFKEMLTDTVKFAIEAAYGSLEKYIATYMEAAVGEVKIAKAAKV